MIYLFRGFIIKSRSNGDTDLQIEELNHGRRKMAKKKTIDYGALAGKIVDNVGGRDNVSGLRHCVTRVRFRLKDESIANDDAIKNMNGVISVVKGGGEYMVVIGDAVEEVYDAVCHKLGMADGVAADGNTGEGKKGNIVIRVLNTIVGSIGPALNMICAGGVMKGLLTVLVMTGLMSAESGMYLLLSGVADAVFYFLPIILGYNLAKHLGGEPFLGLIIGASLCYPTLNGVDISLFGRIVNATYTSSFLPVIIITAIAVPLSKWINKWMPKTVSGFMTPLITLMIVIPIGFAFIGPASIALGNAVNAGINALLNTAPIIAGMAITGLYQILVLFGIHSALTSFSFMNVLSGNPDTVMALVMFPSFAQIGVVLAMYLKTKNEQLKEIALPAFISGIFGVTEPAIYGVTLPHIRMFIVSCIAAMSSGVIVMLTHTMMYSFTGMGIVALLGMFNPEAPNFIPAILAALTPFVLGFVMAYLTYKDEPVEAQDTETEKHGKTTVIAAPVAGEIVPIEEVPDATFSEGLLGHGFAVKPEEGRIYAPFDGTCLTIFDTLHALGLKSESGVELLIHVGLETVDLNGAPFKAHVKSGDKIIKGQLLLEFDMDAIRAAGCPTITPVLVTNEDEVGSVVVRDGMIIVGGPEISEASMKMEPQAVAAGE